MKNQVLIITYYWPPAGGPGVQRWLKFVKYLPDFGVKPIVYCPENPSYPITDDSLTREVSKAVKIVKQPIREPYRLASLFSKKASKQISSGVIPKLKKQSFMQRLLLFVRGNYFIPDARKNWVAPSVKFLESYIRSNNIETIITTGPPHSLHLIGLRLQKEIGVKWIADFRDPWTTIGYHKSLKLSTSSAEKHKRLERKVLQSANHIIVTSNRTKTEFLSKTEQPISVITNGYDKHHIEQPVKDHKFTLAHIGSLLSERNPMQLWTALKSIIDENEEFRSAFELKLIGVVSEDVLKVLEAFNLTPFINLVGYISHEEALKAQLSSRVLLLVEIDSEDAKVIIPGKLFEYMASRTPILAVGPKDSDVETILKSTNSGQYFYYDELEAIKSQILLYFEAYKCNTLVVDAVGLEQYSRKSLTKILSEII